MMMAQSPSATMMKALLLAALCAALASFSSPSKAFLPPEIGAGTTSPTLERGGKLLPLRPEMLPDSQPDGQAPIVRPKRFPNGLTTFVRQDDSLPRVDIVVMVRAGSVAEKPGQQGVATLLAETIRTGGSKTRTPAEVDDLLESMGANLSVSAGAEAMTFHVVTLARSAPRAFEILSELIQQPRLDAEAFETQRGILIDSILRNEDEPAEVARRTFREILYGGGHPLGRSATTSTVAAIKKSDLVAHHQDWFLPEFVSVGITGDISDSQATELINKHWANWRPGKKPQKWPVPTHVKAWDTTTGVVLVTRRTQQTQIRVGHMGLPRRHPDRYAVTLLNSVFGQGGFSSRLMDRVRSMKGLAYGAGGAITSDNPVGLFFAVASTQARTTNAALREILAIIRETATGDITEEELETARKDLVYSFLSEFDSPEAILQKSMNAHFQGEDEDFLPRFVERLRRVTLDEVNAAARAHIHPDRLKILLVGFERAFERPPDEFGPVTRLNPDGTIEGETGLPKPPEGWGPSHQAR